MSTETTAKARDVIARFLWKRDGLPPKAFDDGRGIIGCKRGPGPGPGMRCGPAGAELRDGYARQADELLILLAALRRPSRPVAASASGEPFGPPDPTEADHG